MPALTWLHLSDLHFRTEDLHAWDEDIVLRGLLDDLRRLRETKGLSPDLILVTGDLAFSGAPAEYALARTFFDDLLAATELPKDRLFPVPGNHDVDRKRIGVTARLLAPNLKTREAVSEVQGDATARHEFLVRFEGYAAFLNSYFDHLAFDDAGYFYVHRLEGLAGGCLAVLGLNSAWLAQGGDEDRGRLALGERQVVAALDAAAGAGLRVGLLHHPFEWLGRFDRTGSQALLARDCDFLLHGHRHETELTLHQTPDARAMVFDAGASFDTRRSANAYNLVRLDLEAGQGTVHLRAWSDRGAGFWTKDVESYENAVDGQYTFDLAPRATFRKRKPRPAPVTPAADAAKLEAAYLRKVQLSCNTLPLAVIDPRSVERTRQRTMDLLAVYVDLNTLTQVKEDAQDGKEREAKEQGQEADSDWLAEIRPEGESRPLTALEAASNQRQMVLLGDPGGGKSTFANYLALCLAGARLEEMGETCALQGEGWLGHIGPVWTHGAQLPLRVTLRHFAASEHNDGTAAGLWAFVVESLTEDSLADFAPHLRQKLLDGRVLVIADGLDEVADPEERASVRQALADFATTYGHPKNHYLVTCRVYAYQDPAWQLERFAAHTLAPFSQEQIDAFVDCWYREVCRLGWKTEGEARDLTSRLQGATRRPDLAPLARSPLQLTMMASLHFSWGRLPDDRAELYQEMVRLLLVRWQEARLGEEAAATQAVSAGDLESALERVAFEAHRAQEGAEGVADVGQAMLLDVLKGYQEGSWDRAQELLTYIRERAGLLLEQEPGVYTFPHRSYQEYLAGSYLAREPDFPDQAARLIGDNYAQWREVVLWAVDVMASLKRMTHVAVDAAAALCPRLMSQGPPSDMEWRSAALAGEALLEIGLKEVHARERHKQVLDRLQSWLVALVEQGALPPQERAGAGDTLARLGDPRFDPNVFWLPHRFQGKPEPLLGFLPVPAGEFQMGTREEEIPSLRERYGGSQSWYEREVPQQQITVSTFYIARYPVTVAQFRAFVGAIGFQPGDPGCLRDPDSRPVVRVTWHEARAYCDWLADELRGRENLPPELAVALRDRGWTVRLPTEAEWEKAARGSDGRHYPWGDEFDRDRCNSGEDEINNTSSVGLFPAGASPYGAADMAGNVFEWCQSLYKPYPYRVNDGREGLEAEGSRVLRGGSWDYDRDVARCACRYDDHPELRYYVVGFRVVVAPSLLSGC